MYKKEVKEFLDSKHRRNIFSEDLVDARFYTNTSKKVTVEGYLLLDKDNKLINQEVLFIFQ